MLIFIANARAFYTHTYPHAPRFDLITTSESPTGRLDSLEYRAALIVYPSPTSQEWKMLYKSNICPTIEDAAFEVCYWVEADMREVFDEVLEGGPYVAVRRRTTAPALKSNGQQEEGRALHQLRGVIQELNGVLKKPASKQEARENLWKSRHAPQDLGETTKESETPQDSQQVAEDESKDNAFRFKAGGAGTVPTSSTMAGPSDGTPLTIGLKRKFANGADVERLKRVRAESPSERAEDPEIQP
jgi:hypothetical protein